MAEAGFVWGYWENTDGHMDGSHDTMMSTTVTVDADTTVHVCCPIPDTTSCTCATSL